MCSRCRRNRKSCGPICSTISSIFLALDGSGEALEKRRRLWADLKAHDERLYRRCRHSVAQGCNLPGWLGCKLSIGGYRIAQKLFKFN